MNLAVIPARGGSKRIPRKNIKRFAGIPMIGHAIRVALSSEMFEHVVVSTDDDEIASISGELGAETPFTRPADLADDHTPTVPVILHAIGECEALGWEFDNVCCIYPCTPFLKQKDLIEGLDLLRSSTADYCFPIAEFPSAVQRALKRDKKGTLSPYYPEYETTRTQDLESAYHDAGMFYWGSKESWSRNDHIHSNSIGLVTANWQVVDIDTPDDWTRAELIWQVFGQFINIESEIG